MWNLPQHTYEEIRNVVVDILLKRESVTYAPNQWTSLIPGVGEVLSRRSKTDEQHLHPFDAELVRDVFWDLFRQGFITLGMDDLNPMWPFFRLSHFGEEILQKASPYRFHDTASFISMVKTEVPDISSDAVVYLDEAVGAFYAGCLLASCVMIGVAAEAEILRLVDVAAASATYGASFAAVPKLAFIRQKITKFQSILKPLAGQLPAKAVEDLETNFSMIQSVLRIARNDAGHPTAAMPQREQVYVYLQLYVPFARQLMRLRSVLV